MLTGWRGQLEVVVWCKHVHASPGRRLDPDRPHGQCRDRPARGAGQSALTLTASHAELRNADAGQALFFPLSLDDPEAGWASSRLSTCPCSLARLVLTSMESSLLQNVHMM